MDSDIAEVHRDLLTTAVAGSGTWRDVLRRLGLTDTDERVAQLAARAGELGVSTSHLRQRRPWATIDPETLRRAVENSRTMLDVFTHLGLSPGGASYRQMERLLGRLGIPFEHLAPDRRPPTRRSVSSVADDDLRAAYDGARSIAQILRRVGLVPRGGNYAVVKRRLTALGLDPGLLPGRAWSGGRSMPRRPLEQLLREGVHVSGADLLERLFTKGIFQRRCYDCGASTWRGHAIPLELEHINGDHTDNRLENLKPLCPNCHALTPTYRGRNIPLRKLRAATLE